MQHYITLLAAIVCLWLSACASVPDDIERPVSYTWQSPENTELGAWFRSVNPEPERLSGVLLLPYPREAFLARFAFAGQAERTLDMQYYLWKSDSAGRLLLYQALKAADRGVQVRLLIDDIYHSGRDIAYATIDLHSNVQVRVFNPIGNRGALKNVNYATHQSALNYRMHNKIFLADNSVAILGGRNIGDDYFGVDPNLNFHDLDVIAAGPAARLAGQAFDDYWNHPLSVPASRLLGKELEPDALQKSRQQLESDLQSLLAKMPYQTPIQDHELIQKLESLTARMDWAEAEIVVDSLNRFDGGNTSAFVDLADRLLPDLSEELVIQTAYLIPSEEGIDAMQRLTDKGVQVRILTNSLLSNNHISVHAHYSKFRKDLVDAGVELHELQADNELLEYYKSIENSVADSHAGLHTKAFVVDRKISMIGSYNMDPRSRIWNSEIGLLVHSEPFAAKVLAEMAPEFEPGNSYLLTLDEQGKLLWTGKVNQQTQTWSKDPGASWWKRTMARIIGWLPIEKQL